MNNIPDNKKKYQPPSFCKEDLLKIYLDDECKTAAIHILSDADMEALAKNLYLGHFADCADCNSYSPFDYFLYKLYKLSKECKPDKEAAESKEPKQKEFEHILI